MVGRPTRTALLRNMRPLSMREAPPRPGGTGGPSSGSVQDICSSFWHQILKFSCTGTFLCKLRGIDMRWFHSIFQEKLAQGKHVRRASFLCKSICTSFLYTILERVSRALGPYKLASANLT